MSIDSLTSPLIEAKQQWIARGGATHAERAERFSQLRDINQQLAALLGPRVRQANLDHEQAAQQLERDEIARRRDYAFCLFPEDLLRTFFTTDSGKLPF